MNFLLSVGFQQSQADHTVFYKGHLYILIYINDILLLSNNKSLIKDFLLKLAIKFKYTNNSPVTHFLGMYIKHRPNGIHVHQKAYIKECLQYFGLKNSHPVTTPFNNKALLQANTKDPDPVCIKAY